MLFFCWYTYTRLSIDLSILSFVYLFLSPFPPFLKTLLCIFLRYDKRRWEERKVRERKGGREGKHPLILIYIPRTCVYGLPFSIGKGSMAALKGAVSEHERATREQERACKDIPASVPSTKQGAVKQEPKSGYFEPGFSCLLYSWTNSEPLTNAPPIIPTTIRNGQRRWKK